STTPGTSSNRVATGGTQRAPCDWCPSSRVVHVTFRGGFAVSRFLASTLLVWMVVFALGCAGKPLSQVSPETLIGRWRAVTKDDADEGNATRDARTPTGETVAFRYEFKADHTFEMSGALKGGMMP